MRLYSVQMFSNTFTLWYVLPGSSDLKKCRNLKWIVDTTIAYPRGEAPNGLYLIFSRGKFPPIRIHYRVFDIKSVPRDEEGFKNWMYDRYIEKEAMLERFYKTGSLVDNLTESIDTDVKGAFFSVLFYFVMAVCFSVFLYFPVISLVNFKWILLIVLIYMIYFVYSFVKTFFWWINAVDIISIFVVLSVESFRCTGLWKDLGNNWLQFISFGGWNEILKTDCW